MEWANPPKLPSLLLPNAPNLPIPILEVPQADVPSYRPLVVPPNTLRPPPGIEGINTDPAPEAETKTPTTAKPQPITRGFGALQRIITRGFSSGSPPRS